MSVRERVEPNNTVITRLTIDRPTTASEGQYQMKATNVAGTTTVKFDAHPPTDNKGNRMRYIGLIIGAILGTIILLVVFVCVVRVIRQKPVPYNRMPEPSIQTPGPVGSRPPEDRGASSHQGGESGPFVSEERSYGGVDESKQDEPTV